MQTLTIQPHPGLWNTPSALLASPLFKKLSAIQAVLTRSLDVVFEQAHFLVRPAEAINVIASSPILRYIPETSHPYFWAFVTACLLVSFIRVLASSDIMPWSPTPLIRRSYDLEQDKDETSYRARTKPLKKIYSWIVVLTIAILPLILFYACAHRGMSVTLEEATFIQEIIVDKPSLAWSNTTCEYATSSVVPRSSNLSSFAAPKALTLAAHRQLPNASFALFGPAQLIITPTITTLLPSRITALSLTRSSTPATPVRVLKPTQISVHDTWPVHDISQRYTLYMKIFPQGLSHFLVIVTLSTIASFIALFIVDYIIYLFDYTIWRIGQWYFYSATVCSATIPSSNTVQSFKLKSAKEEMPLPSACPSTIILDEVPPIRTFADIIKESHAVKEGPGDRVLYAQPITTPSFMLEHNLKPRGESIGVTHGLPLGTIEEEDEVIDNEPSNGTDQRPISRIEIIYEPGANRVPEPEPKKYFIRNGLAYDINCQFRAVKKPADSRFPPAVSNAEAAGYVKIIYPTPIDPVKLRAWLDLQIECSLEEAEMYSWF